MNQKIQKKICLFCNTTTSTKKPDGYEVWRVFHDGYLCLPCFNTFFRDDVMEHVRLSMAGYNKKILIFKGKHILLKKSPRTGVCSKCGRSVANGEIKRTNMHHTRYDPTNPLAHTVELCARCHFFEHN